jgi:rhodanese-related sulfurtransferase
MTTSITRDELQSAMAAGDVTVVDALPAAPYERRHLPGALNLTHEDAEARAADVIPDREAAIVTYSSDANCGRGEALADRLTALGYGNVRVYRDGIEDWADAGLPLA